MTVLIFEGLPQWAQHLFWLLGQISLPLMLAGFLGVGLVFLLKSTFKAKGPKDKKVEPFQGYIIFSIGVIVVAVLFPKLAELLASEMFLHDAYYRVWDWWVFLPFLIVVFAFGGAHFLFPRLFKWRLSAAFAWVQTTLTLLGVGLFLIPQMYMMTFPMPLRYSENTEYYQIWDQISIIGACFFVLGIAAFVLMLVEGLVKRRPI